MTCQVALSRRVLRSAKQFFRQHPDLRDAVERLVKDLERDPSQPHLRLHPLHGNLAGSHAVSLTYAYRIVLMLTMVDREMVLIDIGMHDEVYA